MLAVEYFVIPHISFNRQFLPFNRQYTQCAIMCAKAHKQIKTEDVKSTMRHPTFEKQNYHEKMNATLEIHFFFLS